MRASTVAANRSETSNRMSGNDVGPRPFRSQAEHVCDQWLELFWPLNEPVGEELVADRVDINPCFQPCCDPLGDLYGERHVPLTTLTQVPTCMGIIHTPRPAAGDSSRSGTRDRWRPSPGWPGGPSRRSRHRPPPWPVDRSSRWHRWCSDAARYDVRALPFSAGMIGAQVRVTEPDAAQLPDPKA